MSKPTLRCRVCGEPTASCPDLEYAAAIDGWCPCLERALAAAHDGVRRLKDGTFPAAWHHAYCRRQHKRWLPGLDKNEWIERLSDLKTEEELETEQKSYSCGEKLDAETVAVGRDEHFEC